MLNGLFLSGEPEGRSVGVSDLPKRSREGVVGLSEALDPTPGTPPTAAVASGEGGEGGLESMVRQT